MAEVVSSRVDEETRRKMKQLRYVNWSEVMREAIIKKIDEETRRKIDPAEVEEAINLMDQVRRSYPGYEGTEEIRKWREKRK
ncbi:MAG: hypothetical protein ACOC6N_04990 [archaeon]